MSSQDFQMFSPGMFHPLDLRREEFRRLREVSPTKERYESILSGEWAVEECRLDLVPRRQLDPAVENHQNAAALLLSQPSLRGLNVELIKDVHSMMLAGLSEEAGVLRTTEMAPLAEHHIPTEAGAVGSALLNLCEWTLADSFAELHPVQQFALVLIRLLDIHPFSDGMDRTARILANAFLLNAGFPPVIIRAGESKQLQQAVVAGFEMDTSQLTTLAARSLEHVFRSCVDGFSEQR